jgi:hypothetical protein
MRFAELELLSRILRNTIEERQEMMRDGQAKLPLVRVHAPPPHLLIATQQVEAGPRAWKLSHCLQVGFFSSVFSKINEAMAVARVFLSSFGSAQTSLP